MQKLKFSQMYSFKMMFLWVFVFSGIGTATLLITRAATPGIAVVVDSSLPNPTNVKAYSDNRLATITWDKPSTAVSKNIVGYYVTWGAGTGVYTNARQTTYAITQIQPLTNDTLYNVKIQSVQGTAVQVPTPDAWGGGTAEEARANGRVSSGATTTVTPSSARVDQLRTQMTGFFDDFNSPAGAFDELKWNTATSACAQLGTSGAFINNQFHAHSQIKSESGLYNEYCDRAQIIQRPRATFDISGRTEADPGVVVADFDGTSMSTKRDIWYIDLIPLNSRTNNIPLDITGHAAAGDAEAADPAMIRISQNSTDLALKYSGLDKQAYDINQTYNLCPDFQNAFDFLWCGTTAPPIVSAFPEVPLIPYNGQIPVPNVRQHWRVEVSPTKIKLFINGAKVLEGTMPADFASTKKFTVHSNLFSYNTGKDAAEKPQTSILHWDNFGFNGPAPTTVTHNYQEGGVTGIVPYLGTGTVAKPIDKGSRATKVSIPDPIASPGQARLMFTLNNIGFGDYTWSSSDNVVVNGKSYNVPNPAALQLPPFLGPTAANHNIPYASAIIINPADLKQGANDVVFNIAGPDIINAHIELDYAKGSEPAYTPPSVIFGPGLYLASTQPTFLAHDSYLYIEQDMGLPSGVLDGTTPITPPPTTGDTTKPTVALSAPANNVTVTAGSKLTATATASDNVGVAKVEFNIGGTSLGVVTTAPYNATIDTVNLAAGTYTVTATATDAAGNAAVSAARSIIVTAAPTPPNTSVKFVTLPVNSALPSEAECSTRVKPAPETRASVNAAYNARKGTGGNYAFPNVSGNYSGTTDQTIQWAACKWGMDEDLFRAQAVQESYWFQNAIGDFTTTAASCPGIYPIANYPGQAAGQCPESIGIMQVRWNYHQSAFFQDTANTALTNNAIYSTAYNLDYYGAVWRSCYNGDFGWLNTVDRGFDYAAGDVTGCQGVWFAGRWHTAGADQYIAAVQANLNNRTWETSSFIGATTDNPIKSPGTPPPPPPATDTTAPSVSLFSPIPGQTITGTLSINATATDAVGVTNVSFYLDGSNTPFVSDISNPYSVLWNSAAVANGTHTVLAKALDAAGNVGTSAAITINVANILPDTTAPTTSITTPGANASVLGIYTVKANASDNVGVTKVELLIDGVVRATDTSSPFSFAWDTTGFKNGTHTLQTRATDAVPLSGVSSILSVTVNNIVIPTLLKPGDVNGDGMVGPRDISILLFNWNRTNATRAQGDLDGNKVVNVFDVSIVLNNWSK